LDSLCPTLGDSLPGMMHKKAWVMQKLGGNTAAVVDCGYRCAKQIGDQMKNKNYKNGFAG
jgi:hypothetical protein